MNATRDADLSPTTAQPCGATAPSATAGSALQHLRAIGEG